MCIRDRVYGDASNNPRKQTLRAQLWLTAYEGSGSGSAAIPAADLFNSDLSNSTYVHKDIEFDLEAAILAFTGSANYAASNDATRRLLDQEAITYTVQSVVGTVTKDILIAARRNSTLPPMHNITLFLTMNGSGIHQRYAYRVRVTRPEIVTFSLEN